MSALMHSRATETEKGARYRFQHIGGLVQARVLQLVKDAGDAGLTATEAYDLYRGIYGDPPGGFNSIAPRLSNLSKRGLVENSGLIRDRRQAYRAVAHD